MGRFLAMLTGHVGSVYQVAWAFDKWAMTHVINLFYGDLVSEHGGEREVDR
jgi:hypothetical protein